MIDKNHPKLSLRRQCALLAVNRNRLVSRPKLSAEDKEIMRDLDERHTTSHPLAVLRKPQAGPCTAKARLGSGSQASPAPDALDGDGRGRAQAENERAGRQPPEVSLSFTGSDGGSARPGVVHRHYLHPLVAGLRLPRGGDGLAYSRGVVMADLEHAGHLLLPGGPARSVPSSGLFTGDFQHRSRMPVHERGMDRSGRIDGNESQHGWPGALD